MKTEQQIKDRIKELDAEISRLEQTRGLIGAVVEADKEARIKRREQDQLQWALN